MGDLIKNFEIFKKLGFDSTNQWMFYDERFQAFFSHFAENITDENILTEHELLEHNEMQQRNEILPPHERKAQIDHLQEEYPGLMQYKDSCIDKVTNEIEALEETEALYSDMIFAMGNTKSNVSSEVTELESNINNMMSNEKALHTELLELCEELQELQKETRALCDESKSCYKKMQTPPLFIHQLPLDKYFIKCDSFLQYLNLYIKENFKIQDFVELEEDHQEIQEITSQLENIRKLNLNFMEKFIKDKAKSRATQSMIDNLDISKMHIVSISDMKKETRELEMINNHHFNSTYKTIINDLQMHLEQRAQQQMELILYENTKEKLNRAYRRLENVKVLTKTVSDALTNAELIWITTQLDLEKIRNRFDNSDELNMQAQLCLKRIEAMKSLQKLPSNTMSEIVFTKIAEILSKHSTVKVRNEPKACLYEYEKFGRLLKYALNALLNKKPYTSVLELTNELTRIENILKPYVYDSPVKLPMFEQINLLKPIFNAKMNKNHFEMDFRHLRSQFQENIHEKMNNDILWHNGQLLWIWFLTEPKKLLDAVAEIRKAASKVPVMTGVKSLGGIKRKGDSSIP
ncbi:augmin complex subunit dgt3 [Eupeodes corollae]|uniref:augmin complex subunit dgt3 n=1 Tax=Eupeodes corollae TaxID=290404 RepID=UPI0024939707|nr:augmin complex subunit dgt3 [Eupeodes corollae]